MYLYGVCTLQSFWHGRSHLTFMSLSCKFNFEEPGCLLPLLFSQCWITSIKWVAVWEAVVDCCRIQRPRFSYIDNMPETSLSACRGGARKSRQAPICLWGVLSEGYCYSVSPGIEMLNANVFHGKTNANDKEVKAGWMAALLTTMPAQRPCGPAAHSYVLSHLPSILSVHSHIYALTISSFLSKPAQLSLSFVWLLWNFLVVPIWLSELRIHLFLTPVIGKVLIRMPEEWE